MSPVQFLDGTTVAQGILQRQCIMDYRRFTVALVGMYLFSVGLLSGILFDHLQFNHSRDLLLQQLDEHRSRLNQRLMAMEREGSVEQ